MSHTLFRSEDRGRADEGWLQSRFSFSFAGWYDPRYLGFGALRVLNDDVVAPQSGFDLHPHENMEIITVVRSGTVTHRDSLGNEYAVPAGDVQVMTAGTGVLHSEHNRSTDIPLELFQIWIHPRAEGLAPRYAQKSFGGSLRPDEWQLLVAPDERMGALMIHQDAFLSQIHMRAGAKQIYHRFRTENGVFVFLMEGAVRHGGESLRKRDALLFTETEALSLEAVEASDVLIIEVPMV